MANGNFERKEGKILLTSKGRTHFLDRIKNDQVDKKEITSLAKALRTGEKNALPTVWKGEVTLSQITITK
jgi:hypothetical protein